MSVIRIVIASVPDRDELVAELWVGEIQWAELSHDSGDMILQIYSNPTGKPWEFPPDEIVESIQKAKAALLGA
jgi:hypothetical protein